MKCMLKCMLAAGVGMWLGAYCGKDQLEAWASDAWAWMKAKYQGWRNH